LRVVAEGVESGAIRNELSRIGCDLAQGHLFAKPMAEAPMRHWWAEHS
jgi:EAL domain-containing protein (putative c-di-GMP-specific phosphodiesterase class I)